jgi:CheY-like chemotaxis protein
MPGASILVIDDDEIVLQVVSDLLENAGYTVHALVSPIGATQVIATQGVGLAVIDLNMPVMRGDRFITLVRSWDRIRDLPIVLISGESRETIRAAASPLRGVTVMTKAEMSERLVPTVAALLRGDRELADASKVSNASSAREEAGSTLTRALNAAARSALTAWRELAGGRSSPSKVVTALGACRDEAQQLMLVNTAHLLSVALELAATVRASGRVSAELDGTFVELLTQLASNDVEKLRAYDRSLAVTVHRSRLERARSG